jgi:hypothetical protein
MRLAVGGALLSAALGVGCFREATLSDCQLVVDRTVELKLRELKTTQPDVVKKKQAEFRKELEEAMKSECLGRRISEAMMTCVRNADRLATLQKCLD